MSFSAPVLWGRAWLKVVRALQDRWVLEACSVCMRSTRAAPGLQRGSTADAWVPSSVQSHPFGVEETLFSSSHVAVAVTKRKKEQQCAKHSSETFREQTEHASE